ncbi:MAG: polyamine aminopropyltransferase [Spirochaetales bacterium]|nr:polyamine aminopropyltransferase [Spirochaetales bacterium]
MWIKDSWDEAEGRSISIKVTDECARITSEFQEIVIYNTECFGRMMVIDGVIMLTEFDEFAYHEMITHVPLHVHPDPKNVLVIGGGDGGTVREVMKHSVENVILCEIDKEVIRLSKEFFPDIASGLDDPRVHIINENGASFIKNHKNTYDVIIVDSTDPFGPGEALFREEFYRDIHTALIADGIAVTQSESMFYHKETIERLFSFNRNIFPLVKYYYTLVPTYPSGIIGFSFCSKRYDPLENIRPCIPAGLNYYTGGIHRASFVLPGFMQKVIRG